MGLKELINTLKDNEQKQIDDIWQHARAEADSLRKQVDEAIAKITEEHADQLTAACQKSVRDIFAKSELKARKKKLFAYQGLSDMLHANSLKQLPSLRELDYEDVFTHLVRELPDLRWKSITVNPSDIELATSFFDKKIVHPDTAISGGLVAVNEDGKIIIDNTFEKRLERKWTHILPELIKKIESKYGEHGSADTTG